MAACMRLPLIVKAQTYLYVCTHACVHVCMHVVTCPQDGGDGELQVWAIEERVYVSMYVLLEEYI